MFKSKWFAPLLIIGTLFSACSPDTVFLRPGLDTPSQHVVNGQQLLDRGKIDDACREFDRAKELDPNYVKAYVGLGMAMGKKGEFEAGMQTMSMAKEKAASAQDIEVVQKGIEQLMEMKRLSQGAEPTEP
jgi:thioredoxin-like negative regulator of GroEL